MIVRNFCFPLIGEVDMFFPSVSLADFVSRQLINYVRKSGDCNVITDNSQMVLKVYNVKIIDRFKEYCEHYFYASREFTFYNNVIRLGKLEYIITDDALCISYRESKSLLQASKRVIRLILGIGKEAQYRSNSGKFYSKYLFPLFSVFAACYGYYCIHGSLLQHNDKYLILTGLDGVGKSTIANMIASEGGEILADNIVLFNGSSALNFNLLMRVDLDISTKYKTLCKLKEFKEIVPAEINKGEVSDFTVYNIIREKMDGEVKIEEFNGFKDIWELYLNTAPEIEEANRVMAPWSYLNNSLSGDKPVNNTTIYNVYVPEGKILEAKEKICR